MKLFGRKLGAGRDTGASNGVAVAEPRGRPIRRAPIEELLAEIERLTERERAGANLETERDLIRLRNQAGLRRLQRGTRGRSFPIPQASSSRRSAARVLAAGPDAGS